MRPRQCSYRRFSAIFPFLFGGTFIEASEHIVRGRTAMVFPFLFGGTFIEARCRVVVVAVCVLFPFLFGGTFIEAGRPCTPTLKSEQISLPFRRDFH